jgi:hypothetical protein
MADKLSIRLCYALIMIGFILIVISTAEYFGSFLGIEFNLDISTFIFGLVFVAVGLFQESKKQ